MLCGACPLPLLQGLAPPLLRCPSQRLLDRLVRRYAEVADVGSLQMKHFTEKDKLRLLYTLTINQHPLVLQVNCSQGAAGTRYSLCNVSSQTELVPQFSPLRPRCSQALRAGLSRATMAPVVG